MAFCRHKCTATALSTWGMSTYPLAAPPSRVARMEEADEPLLAVKRGLPGRKEPGQGVVASHGPCRGANHLAARARDWEVCTPPAPISRPPGKARPSTLGPIPRRPRHPRGAAPQNLHPQRTIAHPPMPRSTSDPLSARRMKRWARRETAQQNHQGAAQNCCFGRSERSVGTSPAESSHCNPQIAQRTSRWFSARGREASAGSDRGSPSHPREEREARSQRCHGYTLRTNA